MLKFEDDFKGKVSARGVQVSACAQERFCTRALSALPTLLTRLASDLILLHHQEFKRFCDCSRKAEFC
jgi:hypothetical protein